MEKIVNPTSVPASQAWNVTTLLATPSSSVKLEGKKTGVVAKVPALVGKTIVQVYIEALADLEESALDITNIKHDVNLVSCEFIQVESAKSGKLIINGYIRENIDYTAPKVEGDGSVSVGVRRTGMNIPFKCFTKLQLDSEPEDSTATSNPEEDAAAGSVNPNNLFYLKSNEELDFEVAETKIHQVNVKRNTSNITLNNYGEEVFSSLTINMAVDITLMIFQNQFVEIPSNGKSGSSNGKSGSSNQSSGSGNGNSNGNSSGKNGNNSNKGKNKGNKNAWWFNSSKYAWVKNFGYSK